VVQRTQLFSGTRLADVLEAVSQRVPEEVDCAPEDHVLRVDAEEWVAALVERRTMQTPALGEPWMDQPIDVRIPFNTINPFENQGIPGYRVVVHIPFDGDGSIFLLQPSSFTGTVPFASVGDKQLLHVIEYPHTAQVDIKRNTDQLMIEVNRYLGFARADIEAYNASLVEKARRAIENRRERIQRHREHIEATGLPIGPPDESKKTYIADVIVRRPAPILPSIPDSTPIPLEPVLEDEIYEHILGVIRASAASMEQSPATYTDQSEEDRRQFFLATLNTHYQGQATAEAFNFTGKTDLLVRYENNNLFIAEFKFWSGAKSFSAALDQLFSYAAWRDTKLALVIFVRENDLTSVIEKSRDELTKYPQFVELEQAAGETELRAKMSWPGDERRLADLAVFFVHTPKTKD
jgi:hypothetical protein